MLSLSTGEANLRALKNSLGEGGNANEAQTRFHIIDRILFDCLGWDRETEVQVENYDDRTFTDYELGKPRLAILEAKREGEAFELPAGTAKSLKSDLKSLTKMGENVRDAIYQAQTYCSNRGAPIAIVCNGHQFIIFLASRQDGVSVLDGKAVVFASLEILLDNFSLAWQLISAAGVRERNLFRYLAGDQAGIPNKLSSKLTDYPTVRYGSETQATLRQLSELFLQDAIDSPELEEKFFSECYCNSGALSKFALLSKNVLDARYASLFDRKEPTPFVAPVKEKKKDNFSPDILKEALSRRPIVLLGDVGVGKTSFVKNLMYNSAYEEFKNAIYIYIDLGSNASLSSNLNEYILNEIEVQVYEKYGLNVDDFGFIKGVYASEIHKFNDTMWGQKKESDPKQYEDKLFEMLEGHTKQRDQHLKRCLHAYSKSTKRQLIIAVDNADQRSYQIQQDAFIVSQELARGWSATVFMSVRPQTFFKSKRSGALSAYPHKVFTISPPRIDEVISKRLSFALDMAEGSVSIEAINHVRVNARNLALFIKALLSSLSKNKELNEFLVNITGGNIRSAIEFVTNFIGSPNIDANKIVDIMGREGDYLIPLHEFTKSAVLGDYSHYNPDTSVAMNIFDVEASDETEHFLVSFVLAYLMLSGAHRDNDGFVATSFLFEEMQSLSFTSEQISKALRRCTNKKVIETSQRITFEEDQNGILIGEMPDYFRITSIGAYHIKRWAGSFTYIDAMVVDTPIFDSACREDLLKSINSLAIADRYNRASIFRTYLRNVWARIIEKPSYFDFEEIVREGDPTFERVRLAVQSNQQEQSNR